jgi:hypothetical protein
MVPRYAERIVYEFPVCQLSLEQSVLLRLNASSANLLLGPAHKREACAWESGLRRGQLVTSECEAWPIDAVQVSEA